MDVTPGRTRSTVAWVGLGLGPVLAAAAFALAGDGLSDAGRVTLALMAWMATWWMTEAIDVEATSLLPLVVLPLAGAAEIGEAAAPYASPLIYLFMGGFLLALSMQRFGLDRRIALTTLRLVGTRPDRMTGGFMIATAMMSASVSNTATVAMMLPIALSVVGVFEREERDDVAPFRTGLLLAVAYAASIGGLSTIIGSPPNGFMVQYAASDLGIEISFRDWLLVGLPVTVVMLPATWWLLTRVFFPTAPRAIPGGRDFLRRELEALGPVSRGEWTVLAVFGVTVACWLLRPALAEVVPGITDAGIAITAGLALFVLPVEPRRGLFALDWRTAKGLPWGILVLFGGGLSLAAAVEANGVAEFLGRAVEGMDGLPPLVLTLLVTTGVIFLTELTSNTATAATLVPVFAAVAPTLGAEPLALVVPATLAASCAFMLPVATPPNAIVFGSGYITIPAMSRVGRWLNLLGIAIITAVFYLVVVPFALPG